MKTTHEEIIAALCKGIAVGVGEQAGCNDEDRSCARRLEKLATTATPDQIAHAVTVLVGSFSDTSWHGLRDAHPEIFVQEDTRLG